MVISVAVPVPLFKTFDYLPAEGDQIANYKKGQRVLVPFAGRKLIGIIIEVSSPVTKSKLNQQETFTLKHICLRYKEIPALSERQLELLSWASYYYGHPIGECIHTALPSLLRKHISEKNRSQQTLSTSKWYRTTKPFAGKKNATKQIAILEAISGHHHGIWLDALKSMGFSKAQLNALEKSGYLDSKSFDPLTAESEISKNIEKNSVSLNPEQVNAISEVFLPPSPFKVSLLQGVTGSGKTEVYIECVKKVLNKGQQALILIPEINLSPQTLARFQSNLDTPIGLAHSGMSTKERLSSWQLSESGVAKVIIGTRSAIFTPFKNLGLIVVDEEHDSSYKQIDGFKYSARDLAVKKAQLENCPIILGTATPCLESLHNANSGKYHLIKLDHRAGLGVFPKVHLIDIRSRALENGCSRPLLGKIGEELSAGNQVIIFQNRRGFAPTLMCNSCGWISQCNHCDSRLTVHSAPPHLHCHHCNFKKAFPKECENCHYTQLSPIGSGTERIEAGLRHHFPDTKIWRIDRDTIRKQSDMKNVIEEINQGDPCLLIGTQMLAKGHDFHNVTLVAVIDADSSFFSSDFRAIEKSAQQLLQVAGRTGRGGKPGTVLIQTRKAEHPLFAPIIANDYESIARTELKDRELCELPPFSKMISIRADSNIQSEANSALQELSSQLSQQPNSNNNNFQISGPIEASIARKAGMFRSYLHVFVSDTASRSHVISLIAHNWSSYRTGKTKLQIDVDPIDYI